MDFTSSLSSNTDSPDPSKKILIKFFIMKSYPLPTSFIIFYFFKVLAIFLSTILSPIFSIEIDLLISFKLVSISFGLFKALFVKEIVFLDEFLLEFLVLNANYFCYPAKYPPRNQISD